MNKSERNDAAAYLLIGSSRFSLIICIMVECKSITKYYFIVSAKEIIIMKEKHINKMRFYKYKHN